MAKNTFSYSSSTLTLKFSSQWLAIAASAMLVSACLDGPHTHDTTTNTAESEFGDEYWAQQAAGWPAYAPPPLGGAVAPEDRINQGDWSPLLDWPIIATGAANMPDGRIMAWASFKKDTFQLTQEEKENISAFDLESTHGTMFNPLSNSFSPLFSSSHDMFCSGVSMLDDGSVFVAGGGDKVSSTSIFRNGQFTEIESMNQTRWYPTSTTLPSGQVFTSLGNIRSPYPEIWTEDAGWKVLDNVSLQPLLDDTRYDYRDWYPAMNVAPDGTVFHPGHLPELLSIDIDAGHDHSVHSHGDIAPGNESSLYNTTVMYDIGKMLVAGGGFGKFAKNDSGGTLVVDGSPVLEFTNATEEAYTIDLNGNDPVVQPTSPMAAKRSMHNSVVLPNGKVFVVGGTRAGVQFSDFDSVHSPELWDPDTGVWSPMALNEEPRNYHSVAILLKDGRVLSAGGGLCGTQCSSNHQNGRIYSPPYLYDAAGELIARPTINSGSSEAAPGQSITLQGSDDMVEFNMLRLVALTHHHSTDQRMVPTAFQKTAAGQYRLDLHSSANVLVPGYYWVFGLNANGTPSEGHTVKINIATENVPVPPTLAAAQKVAYEYYEIDGNPSQLPNFEAMTAVDQGFTSNFDLSNALRGNNYGFQFESTLAVPATGTYTFYLASDNGSRLYINDELVVDADGRTLFESPEKNGQIELTAGDHSIEVEFYEAQGGSALAVSWAGPGISKRAIASDVLSLPGTSSGGGDTGTGDGAGTDTGGDDSGDDTGTDDAGDGTADAGTGSGDGGATDSADGGSTGGDTGSADSGGAGGTTDSGSTTGGDGGPATVVTTGSGAGSMSPIMFMAVLLFLLTVRLRGSRWMQLRQPQDT